MTATIRAEDIRIDKLKYKWRCSLSKSMAHFISLGYTGDEIVRVLQNLAIDIKYEPFLKE